MNTPLIFFGGKKVALVLGRKTCGSLGCKASSFTIEAINAHRGKPPCLLDSTLVSLTLNAAGATIPYFVRFRQDIVVSSMLMHIAGKFVSRGRMAQWIQRMNIAAFACRTAEVMNRQEPSPAQRRFHRFRKYRAQLFRYSMSPANRCSHMSFRSDRGRILHFRIRLVIATSVVV